MAKKNKIELIIVNGMPSKEKRGFIRSKADAGYYVMSPASIKNKLNAVGVEYEDRLLGEALEIALESSSVVFNDIFNPKVDRLIKKIAKEKDIPTKTVVIGKDVVDSLTYISDGMGEFSESNLMKLYDKYISEEEDPIYDDDKEECIIVDIDRIINDDITGGNSLNAITDISECVDNVVGVLIPMLHSHGYTIAVISSRNRSDISGVERWFNANGISYDLLFSRDEKDERPLHKYKEEVYEKELKDKYNVKMVLTDNKAIGYMWMAKHLNTVRVGNSYV